MALGSLLVESKKSRPGSSELCSVHCLFLFLRALGWSCWTPPTIAPL